MGTGTGSSGIFPRKDPDERLDFSADFTNLLTDAGEAIASTAWTVENGITNEATSNTATVATIVISGGIAGTTYVVRVVVTSNTGTPVRIFDRSFRLPVGEK